LDAGRQDAGIHVAAIAFVVIFLVVHDDAAADIVPGSPERGIRDAEDHVPPDRDVPRGVDVDAESPCAEYPVPFDQGLVASVVRVDAFPVHLRDRAAAHGEPRRLYAYDRRAPRGLAVEI